MVKGGTSIEVSGITFNHDEQDASVFNGNYMRENSVKFSISVNNSSHLFKKWGVSFIKRISFLYDFV
jgi:hypothetical protein